MLVNKLTSTLLISSVVAFPYVALAQATISAVPAPPSVPATSQAEVGEIIVTAQKRSESINKVAMSISAASGEVLSQRGVNSTADLVKIVPGFSFTESPTQQPVYVLRGVGLYDSGLASAPAVTVYVDQIALAAPAMSELSPIDLERVEVLKGPQGTLFGSNSTGGAINYIAARPATSLQTGGKVTYERFGLLDASGFVTGPLSTNVQARLAIRAVSGGAYQYSLSRPDDKLGNHNSLQGRFLLDWQASDRLKFRLNANGFRNKDDTRGQQLVFVKPSVPALANPAFLALKPAPDDPRAADWFQGPAYRANDTLYQFAARADYDLTDSIVITSLTSFEHFKQDKTVDQSGVPIASLLGAKGPAYFTRTLGSVSDISQELRVNGRTGALNWTVGGNYDHEKVSDSEQLHLNLTIDQPLPFIPAFTGAEAFTRQTITNSAVFANADYDITSRLKAHAGARYTKSVRNGFSCSRAFDPAADQNAWSRQFTGLEQVFASLGLKTTPVVVIAPTGCVSLTPAPDISPVGVNTRLDEHNFSWRLGLDYTTAGNALLYVNASRGYKSGVISPFVAAAASEFVPAKQEKLDAYEVGLKAPFANGKVRINAAAFYYDYSDKQLRARIADPVFGLLEILVNIPKSRILGLEGGLQAQPIRGLDLNLAATYLETKVTKSFTSYNSQGSFGDFRGSRLPYTPKLQVIADAQYKWAMASGLNAFAGSSLTYHSSSNATFDTPATPADRYNLRKYALIDLRAGIESADDAWNITIFGRNITNKFYEVSTFESADEQFRSVGAPATYGVTFAVRYK